MERNQRRPPDVEEALSSMLWTPYERTPSESSSDDDEKLNTKLKKSKSSFDYTFPTHYVPSYRKIDRYDNFRFSYPYYGPFPTVPKCITEPPSYDSLYHHNMTPALSNISSLSGRLVHSFTDNFITQNPPVPPLLPSDTTTALLNITNSVSGFPDDFADHGPASEIASSLCTESSALNITSPTILGLQVTIEEKANREELLSNGNHEDPLRAADDLSPRVQRQRVLLQTITTSNDRADLPEEPRVSKPARQYGNDSYSPESRDLAVVAATNDGIKGNRETNCVRAAQTDHERNIELSLRSIFEENGSTVVSGAYSDVANYIDVVESVSSESGGIRNLAVNVRNKLLAMRLNVPAASVSASKDSSGICSANNKENASTTTTSVFLSAGDISDPNSQAGVAITRRNMITNGTLIGAIVSPQPSLTIQVNQSSEICANNQLPGDQPRNVVNQSSGIISVVNCYSSSVPHINSVCNERDVGIVPNVVAARAAAATTTASLSGPVGLSVCSDINNFSRSTTSGIGNSRLRTLERTFTSTESQTDDLHLDQSEISPNISGLEGPAQSQTEALITREQRRRDRRERRPGRNRHPHMLPPPPPPVIRPMLPDILHSHFPPPYTALSLTNPPPPPSSLITPVISTVPIAATAINDGRFTIPLPVIRRSPSERSGKGCCGQWFAGPPLRALIAVVALGGVACALGGAALGATGLAGPPTSHLTAALLMIGVGVILVTVSGAAWRMTAPGGPPCLGFGSTVDLGRCGRRPCSSRGAPHGLLYPEFQHRPPPPSYQASMQEYRLRLLLLDRDRQNGVVRGGSPPPTYRSHAGSLLRTPLSTTTRGGGGNSSSIGGPGSEYSLPPSYRSRNTNTNNNNSSRPPTVYGDESMESLGSNNFNTLSSRGNVPEHDSIHSTTSTSSPEHPASDSSHGGGIISNVVSPATKDRISIMGENHDAGLPRESLEVRSQNLNEKFNPRVISSDNLSCNNSSPSSKSPSKCEQSNAVTNRKELVTIVTISASQGPDESQSEMDILAHL